MTFAAQTGWSDAELEELERSHPRGLAMKEIVDAFGERLTEATFRKYVQLGLLPRSVRVGRGGSRGSTGLYPATVVRRIETIRRLMSQGYSIEEIQNEFFFIRGDIEELTRSLSRVYASIQKAMDRRNVDESMRRRFEDSRELGERLLRSFDDIEQRVATKARMARAAV